MCAKANLKKCIFNQESLSPLFAMRWDPNHDGNLYFAGVILKGQCHEISVPVLHDSNPPGSFIHMLSYSVLSK